MFYSQTTPRTIIHHQKFDGGIFRFFVESFSHKAVRGICQDSTVASISPFDPSKGLIRTKLSTPALSPCAKLLFFDVLICFISFPFIPFIRATASAGGSSHVLYRAPQKKGDEEIALQTASGNGLSHAPEGLKDGIVGPSAVSSSTPSQEQGPS